LLVAAALHTKLGEGEAALKYSSEAIKLTEEWSVIPEEFFIIHSNALLAAGHREEAVAYLQRAYDLMMRVADNTQEASLRRSFLERNPFSRMIVQSYQSHFKKL
jgi:tetratricopeptide (TPR) repeat protein